jgi:general secretion pathway protein E
VDAVTQITPVTPEGPPAPSADLPALLLEAGLSAEQIDRLQKLGLSGERALLYARQQEWIDETTQRQITVRLLGIPYYPHIPDPRISPVFTQKVPIDYARRFGVIGLGSDEGTVHLVGSCLPEASLLTNIANLLGCPVRPALSGEDQITAAINRGYASQSSGVEKVIDAIPIDEGLAEAAELLSEGDLLDTAKRAPVIKLVNLILFEAIQHRASDVHIQPYPNKVQVRFRIDGILHDFWELPKPVQDEILSRIKIIGRMNIAEKRLAQDGRCTVTVGDRIVDLRIATLPGSCGERVVLRLLDKSARLYGLADLGMSQADLDSFSQLITRPYGILLVTGPTGSGKSTTLYAALQYLNAKELNIITLEDPIEYELAGISQTQVSTAKGMTFATGLRSVLRQDPDILMIGEIRDEETARMAIQSALTGHLVFSTLHTNDSAGAVARLLDLGVEPYLVASSLLAVVAQRLVRRICPHCRQPQSLTAEQIQQLQAGRDLQGQTVYEGRGCRRCLATGYFERLGLFEMLQVNDAIRQLIQHRATTIEVKQAAMAAGMRTLRQDAIGKMLAGATTTKEVLRVTHPDEV